MADIKIKNLPTGYQSIITNGSHTIIGDEPIKSKGTDLGLAPTELLLASIAMCKVATVRYIARKNKWEDLIRDVDAHLTQDVKRGEGGKLSTHVKVSMKIEGDITAEQKAELMKQADHCYIHRMLQSEFIIDEATEWSEEA